MEKAVDGGMFLTKIEREIIALYRWKK